MEKLFKRTFLEMTSNEKLSSEGAGCSKCHKGRLPLRGILLEKARQHRGERVSGAKKTENHTE